MTFGNATLVVKRLSPACGQIKPNTSLWEKWNFRY